MSRLDLLVLAILLSVLLLGCENQNPHFERDKVKAEPSFLRPSDREHNQLILHYTINNPTKYDFRGKVSYKYNEDCISLNDDETTIDIALNDDDAAAVTVRTSGMADYDDECYGTQNILLILSNTAGTVVYDSQNVEIAVTR